MTDLIPLKTKIIGGVLIVESLGDIPPAESIGQARHSNISKFMKLFESQNLEIPATILHISYLWRRYLTYNWTRDNAATQKLMVSNQIQHDGEYLCYVYVPDIKVKTTTQPICFTGHIDILHMQLFGKYATPFAHEVAIQRILNILPAPIAEAIQMCIQGIIVDRMNWVTINKMPMEILLSDYTELSFAKLQARVLYDMQDCYFPHSAIEAGKIDLRDWEKYEEYAEEIIAQECIEGGAIHILRHIPKSERLPH